jgi:hypothetical protein
VTVNDGEETRRDALKQGYFEDILSYFGNPVDESTLTYCSEFIDEYFFAARAGWGGGIAFELIRRCTLYTTRSSNPSPWSRGS